MALRAVPDHPKFAELMAMLGLPKFATLGALEGIWHFTGRYAPQGNVGKYSDQAIEAWVGWNGAQGALIDALVNCRWVDRDPIHRLLIHDWAQHADKATKNALMRAKLPFCTPTVRTEGVHHTDKEPETSTASRLPEPEPVPEPESKDSCAEPSPAPALHNGRPIALLTNSGDEWIVTERDRLRWRESYPGIDVTLELLKARSWLDANQSNRKTAGGMRRFIVGWLSREQNKSRPTANHQDLQAHRSTGSAARTERNRAAWDRVRTQRDRSRAASPSGDDAA